MIVQLFQNGKLSVFLPIRVCFWKTYLYVKLASGMNAITNTELQYCLGIVLQGIVGTTYNSLHLYGHRTVQ